jgi:RNA polymerase sigma-70 factor (ECF subfamily)
MEWSCHLAPDPIEADLLAKARAGSALAFEEIVVLYQRRVYAVARRIVRHHHAADDVTQETFLRAWQALGGFDLERPFGPWICRIAANTAINQVRAKENREDPLEESFAEDRTDGADALAQVGETETRAALNRAFLQLPAEQRAVLQLRAVEELSYKEIAAALDISIGTVMSRLSRARERLRGLLAERA